MKNLIIIFNLLYILYIKFQKNYILYLIQLLIIFKVLILIIIKFIK